MNKEITIGIDVSRANRMHRGIPIYTRSILHEFGKTEMAEGVTFVLLHYPDKPPNSNFGIDDACFEQIPYSGEYRPWARILQEQILYPYYQRKIGLDVFWHPQNHGQYWTPVGYVLTLHDVLPLSRPELSQDLDSLDTRMLYHARIFSASRADRIITVSEYSKAEIVRFLGTAPDKIEVIYNGIDHSIFFPHHNLADIRQARRKYNLPERYLLTVGSYSPHKNLRTLVDAYAQSKLPAKGIGLVMVGPKDESVYTSDATGLEEYMRSLGLSSLIRTLSPVPGEDLSLIYCGAEFFVITSFYEGFGFPPLEAMACGVPVVSSNSTSLPEVCGDAALYADPRSSHSFADRFNELFNNGMLEERLVSQGLKQARRFNWKDTADHTLRILKSVSR